MESIGEFGDSLFYRGVGFPLAAGIRLIEVAVVYGCRPARAKEERGESVEASMPMTLQRNWGGFGEETQEGGDVGEGGGETGDFEDIGSLGRRVSGGRPG